MATTLTFFGLDSQGLAEGMVRYSTPHAPLIVEPAISISAGLSFYDCVASVPYDITSR